MGNTAPDIPGWPFTRLRIERGWSKRELAEAAGVSHGCITRIEAGKPATRANVKKLVRVLGPAVNDLVRLWPPPPDSDLPLAVARRAWDVPRRQAAKRIGVPDGVLGRAERGESVHPSNAKRIADAYGLSVEDVLFPKASRDREAA